MSEITMQQALAEIDRLNKLTIICSLVSIVVSLVAMAVGVWLLSI